MLFHEYIGFKNNTVPVINIFRFVNRDMVGASHDVICPISQAKPNFNIDLVSIRTIYIRHCFPKIFCVESTVSVISSNHPCYDKNARFTTVTL